jgi:hypothetical protein
MIPVKIIRFLEDRANVSFAGTRDGNLVPRGHRVSGWQADGTGRTLTIFFPSSEETRLVEALQNNGPIAVTFEEVGTHETYQIKGRYLSHRPVRSMEIDIANRERERFARGLHSLFPDGQMAAFLKSSIPPPGVAVEIEVQEVFVQTPGPGAGARIVPAPDAVLGAR